MVLAATLLVLLACTAAGAQEQPVVQFPGPGTELSKLPGTGTLQPKGPVRELDIRLVRATVEGPEGTNGRMLRFDAPLYQSEGNTFLHGPTLRLKAGDKFKITLTNDLPLPDPAKKPTVGDTGFAKPTHTNLHVHGIHGAPGLQSQTVPVRYQGDDNVLVSVPPNGGKLAYSGQLPENHLPGLHWYHPHRHHSSTVQVFSANGLIIVEDDPKWLPDANGCKGAKAALSSAPEVLLHLELLTFAKPNPNNDTGTAGWYDFIGPVNASLDDTNIQSASEFSSPQNPLMTDGAHGPTGVQGSAAQMDILLVNGGWKPKLSMKAGQWQRWRVLHSGYKRFIDLQVVHAATGKPAPRCLLMLLAKDGLYLPQIPRPVDHIFLTSGNRAELLVRCLDAGEYVVTAGRRPSPFGPKFGSLSWFKQDVVVSLSVKRGGKPSPGVASRKCTPLTPAYATDLSDASLAKAGATKKLLPQSAGFTFGNQVYGCLVNDKNFTMPDPEPLLMPLGQVVEWKAFTNLMEHPLHLHTNPFQIMGLPLEFLAKGNKYTAWFEAGDRHDTLQLPMMANPNNTVAAAIALRVQPGPFTGYSVMHCHFIHHEDEGCMKMVKWACPGHNDPQPKVCPGFKFPVPGTLK